MDLGKKESQVAIITEARELIETRIRTERERLVGASAVTGLALLLVDEGWETRSCGAPGSNRSSRARGAC